jgi:DNA-directed RNA polymerase subunit M/transcription elongation factor TFIIS
MSSVLQEWVSVQKSFGPCVREEKEAEEGHRAVFYQDQARRITTNMTLFFYCTHCKHLFRDPKVRQR